MKDKLSFIQLSGFGKQKQKQKQKPYVIRLYRGFAKFLNVFWNHFLFEDRLNCTCLAMVKWLHHFLFRVEKKEKILI